MPDYKENDSTFLSQPPVFEGQQQESEGQQQGYKDNRCTLKDNRRTINFPDDPAPVLWLQRVP